jgi:hypothetical protein
LRSGCCASISGIALVPRWRTGTATISGTIVIARPEATIEATSAGFRTCARAYQAWVRAQCGQPTDVVTTASNA